VLTELASAGGSSSIPSLETATGIRRGRLELLVKVLAVEGAVERTVEGRPVDL
jgi:ATP-dependent DNA helicase RecQ